MIPLVIVIVLALIHAFAGRSPHFNGNPRGIWSSLAGGIAVAYVFMHLFPQLHEAQRHVDRSGSLHGVQHPVYLMALIGLCVFYGLEYLVVKWPKARRNEEVIDRGIFWTHMASFALYNMLIGLLIHELEGPGMKEAVLFTLAMGTHFLVNDLSFERHHRRSYLRLGRWLLAGALLLGWALGMLDVLSRPATIMITAFIGGGVVLNVLKEELPAERNSRYWAFLVGVLVHTIAWQAI